MNMHKSNCTVLHLDGNKSFLMESFKLYREFNVDAICIFLKEYLQPRYIYNLLLKYNPKILVITGHDSFYPLFTPITNINNYINSKYFISAVTIARSFNHDLNKLVIIAGACESDYELLIKYGANFASSPKRISINVADPVYVACKLANTPQNRILTIKNIYNSLPLSKNSIGGIPTRGQA